MVFDKSKVLYPLVENGKPCYRINKVKSELLICFSLDISQSVSCIMHPQGRAFLIQQIIWIAIGFAISLAISFLVPFPYSLGIMMGIFLGLSYAIRAWAMRKIRRPAGHLDESIYDYFLGFSQGKPLKF